MATLGQIEQFDSSRPSQWRSYEKRFRHFLTANEITGAARRRAVFLSTCGAATFDLAQDLFAPDDVDAADLDEILRRLQEHYDPQPGEIACRYVFYQRGQREGESIAEFTAALRNLARDCQFSNLEEALRDRFVCGLRDEATQRRLFGKKGLTFKEALEDAANAEAANRSARTVRGHEASRHPPVEKPTTAVHHEDLGGDLAEEEAEVDHNVARPHRRPATSTGPCAGCAGPHVHSMCRFRDATCRVCGKKGHIARACRSEPDSASHPVAGENAYRQPRAAQGNRGQREVTSRQRRLETNSTRTVILNSTRNGPKEKIRLRVSIEGAPCTMELDTGSSLSIISNATLKRLCPHGGPPLRPLPYIVKDYMGGRVPIKGVGDFHVCFRDFAGKLPLVIVEGERTSLLGLD
ncbi:uncharacterized protein LOC143831150 [Paroedura picta]|uniref:uncharacterized protein LOC143831150 n=1 Tax=Paroedura picta TaxID=143630 RepID=UPI00405696E2